MTLDTISVLVTQYNNTAVTRTTTIHQDLSSINISTLSDVQSTAFEVLTAIDPEYMANGFALNNGTNAFVDGTFTVAYPTPFIGIQGFEFISVTQQDPRCPKGQQSATRNLGTVECACMMQTYMDDPNLLQYTATSQITLSSTYYELGNTHPVDNDLGSYLEGPIPINNVSYSNFIESVLGSEGFDKYRSCVFLDVGVGPPALMIPVSALTATATSTVQSAGSYGVQSPKPGSPVAAVVPSQTNTPAVPPPVPLVELKSTTEPLQGSSTAPFVASQTVTPGAEPIVPIVKKPSPQNAAPGPGNELTKAESQRPVESSSDSTGTGQTGSNGVQHAVGPSDSGNNDQADTGAQPVTGTHLDNSKSGGSNTADTKPVPLAAVAISYAGSNIIQDTSSHYDIPQVGKLSPGGSPITTNNVIYSLAPSATALVSNGQIIPLPTITAAAAAAAPENVKQLATPVLTFAGSAYTADSSSNIVVNGQTIVPGGPPVTVSNTPISLARGASVAVIAGTTQSLYSTAFHPELTFKGATYTANSDSAFLIQDQTLFPGSPAITVSNTPISLVAPVAGIAVIAGQTQILSARPIFTAKHTLLLNGSTYTADAASNFLIDAQTLSPGGVVTVSNTPVSLAAGASFAVIAGSTIHLAFAPIPTSTTPTPTFTASPMIFTFDGSTYTAGSEFLVIAGQTLTKGGAVTVSGTLVSYLYGSGAGGGGGGGGVGGDVVVGSKTEAVVGLGGLIMGGFGNGNGSTAGPAVFTGVAAAKKRLGGGFGLGGWWCFVGGGMVLLGFR